MDIAMMSVLYSLAHFSFRALKVFNSFTQGLHQVAQKQTTLVLPLLMVSINAESLVVLITT